MNNSFTEMGSLKPGFLTSNFLGRSDLGVPEDLLALEVLLSEFNSSSHTEFTYTLPNDWNNVKTDGSHTLTSRVSDLTCTTGLDNLYQIYKKWENDSSCFPLCGKSEMFAGCVGLIANL
jgi:hypothetical protein